jgi:hypothetical protein
MPGKMPEAGQTLLLFFGDFYEANKLAGPQGNSEVAGFHLRVAALATKIVHNWGVGLLGGTLVSSIALPLVYEHLNTPFGKWNRTGLANPDLGLALLTYHRRDWHWWYGLDVYTPSPNYIQKEAVNIGQHYFSTAPQGAFTYLPDSGNTEVSSKFQYLFNNTNAATHYHSGNEFIWEYAVKRNVTKAVSIGPVGYYYQQTTDDTLNGLLFAGGNRARALAVGPQVRFHLSHFTLILKYQRETLVENRAQGNAFWLELGTHL